ncbi:uncharacterized protein Tco025E_09519 [Trypanosoma conorhini]|uniref:Uncharacterized protein n=1 Tax=Trypanosoma conorhini TaxID=83891 RepID=A0A422MVB5_9TRYP|nr:uncharacterized protein Tco025E_09519 [Trypanosoma conorhini]RNE97178.1 hypothetical protein Tco025E_09519 [Trypanosoma conorhini]
MRPRSKTVRVHFCSSRSSPPLLPLLLPSTRKEFWRSPGHTDSHFVGSPRGVGHRKAPREHRCGIAVYEGLTPPLKFRGTLGTHRTPKSNLSLFLSFFLAVFLSTGRGDKGASRGNILFCPLPCRFTFFLAMRAFFSPTHACLSGAISASLLCRSLLSEASMRSAFRRSCAAEGVGLHEGVSEDVLASAIVDRGVTSLADAKAQLRSSSAFRIDAGVVYLAADGDCERSQLESMLLRVAAKIPASGVSGSQLQAILEDEAPHFQPSVVGALSLKDAVRSFPHIFLLESEPAGKWTVRSVASALPGASACGKGGPHGIVDFCRRRALMGHQGAYTPLRLAMQKTGITEKDLLKQLVMNEEVARVLQVKLSVRLRPKRAPTNAFCFVDGDEIGPAAVEAMGKGLTLSDKSTRVVARHPASPKHSSADIIVPEEMPTYAVLELKARELLLRQAVILQDVIYMCSSNQFTVYAEKVARLNAFPDADVYVCCPSRVKLVAEKQHVPL